MYISLGGNYTIIISCACTFFRASQVEPSSTSWQSFLNPLYAVFRDGYSTFCIYYYCWLQLYVAPWFRLFVVILLFIKHIRGVVSSVSVEVLVACLIRYSLKPCLMHLWTQICILNAEHKNFNCAVTEEFLAHEIYCVTSSHSLQQINHSL